jgi:RNA polymerase sigma-70 factor (ECF subfamily)
MTGCRPPIAGKRPGRSTEEETDWRGERSSYSSEENAMPDHAKTDLRLRNEAGSSIEAEILCLAPALHAFAHRFHRNPDDADDLVQDTIVKALAHREHYQGGTALKSWLFTIMRNTFCTHYRRSKREQVGLDQAVADTPIEPRQEWAVRQTELRKALHRLPPRQRQALVLVTLGTSYEETARLCDCEIGTVKSRVNRARQELLTELGETIS